MNLADNMRFGTFMAPFHRVGENPTLALERDLELLDWLDDLGFDEAWVGEHHSGGWETIASLDEACQIDAADLLANRLCQEIADPHMTPNLLDLLIRA